MEAVASMTSMTKEIVVVTLAVDLQTGKVD
jgi:hypothetical protein